MEQTVLAAGEQLELAAPVGLRDQRQTARWVIQVLPGDAGATGVCSDPLTREILGGVRQQFALDVAGGEHIVGGVVADAEAGKLREVNGGQAHGGAGPERARTPDTRPQAHDRGIIGQIGDDGGEDAGVPLVLGGQALAALNALDGNGARAALVGPQGCYIARLEEARVLGKAHAAEFKQGRGDRRKRRRPTESGGFDL